MIKRIFDLLFSFFVLLFTFPILAIVAIIVKFTSKGPVFYPSIRIGKDGKEIRCWKFRSMVVHADTILQEVLSRNPELKQEWEKFHKLKKDPRVTKIGSFLRKTSLDEFPQFWNVFVGDLSIVGPRPALPEEVQMHFGYRAKKILSIRPGITGIWQTSGRNLLTFEQRVQLEESYVDKQSFFFDLKLIVKTVPMLLFPKGAF